LRVYLTEILELGPLAAKNAERVWRFRNQWPAVPFSNCGRNTDMSSPFVVIGLLDRLDLGLGAVAIGK
jgi:hypothetical protein